MRAIGAEEAVASVNIEFGRFRLASARLGSARLPPNKPAAERPGSQVAGFLALSRPAGSQIRLRSRLDCDSCLHYSLLLPLLRLVDDDDDDYDDDHADDDDRES